MPLEADVVLRSPSTQHGAFWFNACNAVASLNAADQHSWDAYAVPFAPVAWSSLFIRPMMPFTLICITIIDVVKAILNSAIRELLRLNGLICWIFKACDQIYKILVADYGRLRVVCSDFCQTAQERKTFRSMY